MTGAGLGIGRGTALRFATEGARLVLADIDAARLDETARLIGGRAEVLFVCTEQASYVTGTTIDVAGVILPQSCGRSRATRKPR